MTINNKRKFIKIIIIINIVLALILLVIPTKKSVIKDNLQGDLYFSTPMNNDTNYIQRFISPVNNLYEIDIKFSTFLNQNHDGKIKFSLYDNNNNVINEQIIRIEEFEDNKFYPFKFKAIKDSKDKEYYVVIKYDNYIENNKLAYWMYVGTDYKTYINNEEQEYIINMHFNGYENDYFTIWYTIIIILTCIPIFIIINEGDLNEKKKK